jgi:hypothetical protein
MLLGEVNADLHQSAFHVGDGDARDAAGLHQGWKHVHS